jgi:hypothetical protein
MNHGHTVITKHIDNSIQGTGETAARWLSETVRKKNIKETVMTMETEEGEGEINENILIKKPPQKMAAFLFSNNIIL